MCSLVISVFLSPPLLPALSGVLGAAVKQRSGETDREGATEVEERQTLIHL